MAMWKARIVTAVRGRHVTLVAINPKEEERDVA